MWELPPSPPHALWCPRPAHLSSCPLHPLASRQPHVAATARGGGSAAHRAAPAQVLQGGGLESPTKPKGRPKKNSIPTSEQLSEQERAKEAEKPEKPAEAPGEASDKGRED